MKIIAVSNNDIALAALALLVFHTWLRSRLAFGEDLPDTAESVATES
jgi:hypothetical protein